MYEPKMRNKLPKLKFQIYLFCIVTIAVLQ